MVIQKTDDYYYSLNASGSNSHTGGFGNSSADSFGMVGIGLATGNFNASGLTGTLAAGTYLFGGSVGGSSAGNHSNSESINFTLTLTPVPEPASIAVLGVGVLGLADYGWRRRKRSAKC